MVFFRSVDLMDVTLKWTWEIYGKLFSMLDRNILIISIASNQQFLCDGWDINRKSRM